jgi:glutamate-1-semialdehyde 2,1-aminomutase
MHRDATHANGEAPGAALGAACFDTSRQLIEAAKRHIPGGVSSNFRMGIAPTPLVFERAQGPWLFDADGNRLIDYYLGMGPMILGHSPEAVRRAVARQLDVGILWGGQSRLEAAVAERFCEMVPCAEKLRFAASGSEVVQAALRLARAATSRRVIIKFEGHYHGWLDSVLLSVSATPETAGDPQSPNRLPGSAGQDEGAWSNVEVLRWNDLQALERRLAARDVAAVIMEPAMCNAGSIRALPGYLEGVREACSRTGTVLIFDEVITGFRVAPGGVQQLEGVTPDLATFGKCLGNGLPIAAVAGRAELMDRFATGGVVHGGTYNASPLCLAAADATLKALEDGSVLAEVGERGQRLMQGIDAALKEAGVTACVSGFGQIFHVAFGLSEPARDYRDLMRMDRARYVRFCEALLSRRVRVLERGAWFLSSEHDDAVIDETLAAVREAVQGA